MNQERVMPAEEIDLPASAHDQTRVGAPISQGNRPKKSLKAAMAAGVFAVAGAGVGIGHLAWGSPISTQTVDRNTFNSPRSFAAGFGSSGLAGSKGSVGVGNTGSLVSDAAGGPANASDIAQEVDAGLVDINTNLSYQGEEAAGTGMVLTANGEILTNNHVIEGATSIKVTDIGNGKTYSAKVVGYDVSDDVAVLQLANASGLKTVSVGDSANVVVGDTVVGIGNAEGAGGTPSYAGGVLTATNRTITASDEGAGTTETLSGMIGTNADIEPGDSGGPLVDSVGQVIGMDTAGSSSSGSGFTFTPAQGSTTQGFAIPINHALSIAKRIETGASSSTIHIGATSFLGVEVQSSSDVSQNGFGGFGRFGNGFSSGASMEAGAVIAGVIASSPAAKAGLVDGNTIVSINGATVASPSTLSSSLKTKKPGATVVVGFVDAEGEQHSVSVRLASGPPQ